MSTPFYTTGDQEGGRIAASIFLAPALTTFFSLLTQESAKPTRDVLVPKGSRSFLDTSAEKQRKVTKKYSMTLALFVALPFPATH
jgi:hypothetical protein